MFQSTDLATFNWPVKDLRNNRWLSIYKWCLRSRYIGLSLLSECGESRSTSVFLGSGHFTWTYWSSKRLLLLWYVDGRKAWLVDRRIHRIVGAWGWRSYPRGKRRDQGWDWRPTALETKLKSNRQQRTTWVHVLQLLTSSWPSKDKL